jgi:HSP20 family molecular chaperone IbpA
MNQTIQPIKIDTSAPAALLQEIEDVFGRIRKRAYELFSRRGATPGSDLEDWLAAERDIFNVPASELKETERDYTLDVAATGFEPNEIKVAVEPGSITIRAKAERKQERRGQKTVYSEWEAKEMFRRFDLADPINPDTVKANLDSGMLHVVMPKQVAASTNAKAA